MKIRPKDTVDRLLIKGLTDQTVIEDFLYKWNIPQKDGKWYYEKVVCIEIFQENDGIEVLIYTPKLYGPSFCTKKVRLLDITWNKLHLELMDKIKEEFRFQYEIIHDYKNHGTYLSILFLSILPFIIVLVSFVLVSTIGKLIVYLYDKFM